MAKRSFPRFVEQEFGKFPHFLLYAVLEWVLIVLLFIDGFLAFAANEFAKFFELRTPCLLCTRIDHVLAHRNHDYYNDSICQSHKKEVSRLAYCHVHKKLSDIRKMCETCLLSFATEKEADIDTYKSLVGILHKDVECFLHDDHEVQLSWPVRRDDGSQERRFYNKCSCCGIAMKVKSMHVKLKNPVSQIAQAPANSPRAPRNLEARFTDIKLCDNESEIQNANGNNQGKEDNKAATVPVVNADDLHEDNTPVYGKGNKFFGIALSDSANNSPRWASRLGRKSAFEKTELTMDSADGHGTNDQEDLILNHLKGQVRLDRKSLISLYMELDEERNASAVAANNAMAMITRLQAEKAAVQMEALQYQRMMEEQAEYDQEALQQASEMLAKKDEDLKELEAELEAYQLKYGYLQAFERRADEENSVQGGESHVENGGEMGVKSPKETGDKVTLGVSPKVLAEEGFQQNGPSQHMGNGPHIMPGDEFKSSQASPKNFNHSREEMDALFSREASAGSDEIRTLEDA